MNNLFYLFKTFDIWFYSFEFYSFFSYQIFEKQNEKYLVANFLFELTLIGIAFILLFRCHNTTRNVIIETMVIMKSIEGLAQGAEARVEALDTVCLKHKKNIITDKGRVVLFGLELFIFFLRFFFRFTSESLPNFWFVLKSCFLY